MMPQLSGMQYHTPVLLCFCLMNNPFINYFFSYITPTHSQTNARTFHSLYGVAFQTAAILFAAAVSYDITISPLHILWFLHWCRQYPTVDVGSHYWGCDVKTYRKYLFRVLLALFVKLHTVCIGGCLDVSGLVLLLYCCICCGDVYVFVVIMGLQQISLQDRAVHHMFSLVLDATVCPINRPSVHLQQWFYSGKHKVHCIKYEIGVHPVTGHLVWVGGPTYGSMHDMKLFYLCRILQGLLPREFILADMGYIGNWRIVTQIKQPTTWAERLVNAWISAQRWIVEHVFGRFKWFNCLTQRWRHDIELHAFIFFVLAEIINIDMYFNPVRRQ